MICPTPTLGKQNTILSTKFYLTTFKPQSKIINFTVSEDLHPSKIAVNVATVMWHLCFVGFSSTLFEQLKRSCGSLRSFSISHDQFMDCNERELYESLPKTLAHFGLPHCNIDLEKFKTIISPGTVYCVFLLYQYISFPLQQDSFFAWAGCSCWGGAKYQMSFADWWSTNKKIEKQNIKTASIWPRLIPYAFCRISIYMSDVSGSFWCICQPVLPIWEG